jgi:hypothetical protein
MSASSSRYRGRGQPNVGVQHDKLDGLTFPSVRQGLFIDNQVVDVEIVGAFQHFGHGSVEAWVEEGRRGGGEETTNLAFLVRC